MAAVSFDLPDDVRAAFEATFKDEDRSAIVARLIHDEIVRAQVKQRSHDAITRILKRREHAPVITEDEFRAAREEGRP